MYASFVAERRLRVSTAKENVKLVYKSVPPFPYPSTTVEINFG